MTLRRSLAFSYLERYASYLVGLVSTIIISRLLVPADIGVFAIGMALVSIVAVVRELGVSVYVVQEADLSADRIRAAFTLTAGMGLALGLIVLLISGPAGRFYGDPRVTRIISILALGFALTPIGSISQALLSREMRFGTLTWIRLLHGVSASVLSIALVAAGMGPESLAWGLVASAAINGVVSMAVRPHPVLPNLSPAELRRVFSVGGPATVIAVIEDIVGSLPELVLGRMQGLAATGLFSRARGLSQMAHQLIARTSGPVFFAAFAALQREGHAPGPLYVKATACVTALGWTALGSLAVLSTPVVALLFGPTWADTVPLLRWLSLAAAVTLLTSGANHLLLASGAARDAMWAKLNSLPVHAVCLYLGGSVGVEGMAASAVLSSAISSALLIAAVQRRLGIGWRHQLSALQLSLPTAIAGMCGASAGLLVGGTGPLNAAIAIGLGAVGAALMSCTVLMLGANPLKGEVTRVGRAVSDRLHSRGA